MDCWQLHRCSRWWDAPWPNACPSSSCCCACWKLQAHSCTSMWRRYRSPWSHLSLKFPSDALQGILAPVYDQRLPGSGISRPSASLGFLSRELVLWMSGRAKHLDCFLMMMRCLNCYWKLRDHSRWKNRLLWSRKFLYCSKVVTLMPSIVSHCYLHNICARAQT